jgi:hypothetical protein
MSRYLILVDTPIPDDAVAAELRRLGARGGGLHLLVPVDRLADTLRVPSRFSGRTKPVAASPVAGPENLADTGPLHRLISELRLAGLDTTGELATLADPVAAIEQAVTLDRYEAVVVLGGGSPGARRLKVDVASRIDCHIDLPVVAVDPAPEAAGSHRSLRARVTEARHHLDGSWGRDADRYDLERELMARYGLDRRQAGYLLAERSAAAPIEAPGLGGHGRELETIVDDLIMALPAPVAGSR